MTYNIQLERAKALASIAARQRAKQRIKRIRVFVLSICLAILVCIWIYNVVQLMYGK